MNQLIGQRILRSIEHLRAECDLLERQIQLLQSQKEWLTTAEFSVLTGLKLKTISNYCGDGKIGRLKKQNGKWLIHRDELENY